MATPCEMLRSSSMKGKAGEMVSPKKKQIQVVGHSNRAKLSMEY